MFILYIAITASLKQIDKNCHEQLDSKANNIREIKAVNKFFIQPFRSVPLSSNKIVSLFLKISARVSQQKTNGLSKLGINIQL